MARSNATNDNVMQKVYMVAQSSKQALLTQLLTESNSQQVIIFTKTKITASKLSRALQKEGITADAIHGDKSQKERIEALDAFKAGKITALVATDVAARGLDISDLPMVINYEIPGAPEDYVHRIGRTGRAGASGIAISLVCEEEEKYLADIEKLIKRSISRETVEIKNTVKHATKSATSQSGHNQPENDSLNSNRQATKPRQQSRKPSRDPWFDKPYEPSISTKHQQHFTANSSSKAPVAALLGGLRAK